MPKINVYLPDELAAAVKEANVPVSATCQAALERAVREVTSLREGEARAAGADQLWLASAGTTFSLFTNRARQAVLLARHAAIAEGRASIGTRDVLHGVLEEGTNLAVRVLEALDVAPDDVTSELRGLVRREVAGASGASAASGSGGSTEPFTATGRAALDLAVQEGARLGHNYVGCEHLLLGLIAEPDGLGGSVLRQLGLELRVTRRAVVTALSGFLHAQRREPSQSPPDDRLDEVLRRLDAIEAKLAG